MPKSSHIPGYAGGIESVTGEAIIDTGIRKLVTAIAVLNEANVVSDEESVVSWYKFDDPPNVTQKIVIRVEKGGANHGTLGDTPVQVAWMALAD